MLYWLIFFSYVNKNSNQKFATFSYSTFDMHKWNSSWVHTTLDQDHSICPLALSPLLFGSAAFYHSIFFDEFLPIFRCMKNAIKYIMKKKYLLLSHRNHSGKSNFCNRNLRVTRKKLLINSWLHICGPSTAQICAHCTQCITKFKLVLVWKVNYSNFFKINLICIKSNCLFWLQHLNYKFY